MERKDLEKVSDFPLGEENVAFVQLSCNYLNLTRGMLAEHYAEASMKTILSCLRKSLADSPDQDSRGNLMISSALSLSGIRVLTQ